MKTALRITLILFVMLAVLPGMAGAAMPFPQGAGEVTYGTPVEGALTNEVFSQDWTFTAQSADRINVHVERLDGNLIPDVLIVDNNGQEIANSYGSDYTYAAAEIPDFDLPLANTYTIRVQRDDLENGLTTGTYRLTVTPLGVGADHPTNTEVVSALEYDTPAAGEITGLHWWNIYTLEGETGDYIQVKGQRINGSLIPEVWLLDNNGQELTRGYSSNTGDSATLNAYELPYTGQYQVVATREYGIGGDTVGGFELTVKLLGSGEESTRLTSATPGVIEEYNLALQGTITGEQWYQDWQFRTLAADTISIFVGRWPEYTQETPNILEPAFILLDSTGQELTRGYVGYTGTMAAIERYKLPGEGQYTVRVSRDGYKTGVTTGMYEFAVILIGSGEGSPLLSEPTGTLALNEPMNGNLASAGWMDIWAFSGQEGQVVTVTATRTVGTLIPRLEIWDSNGVSQTSAYPDATMATVSINQYRLSYTGEFQIVVLRDGDQDGYTSGSYSLTIQ